MTNIRYDGKRVLVVGGATGMGAAAAQNVAELGAEVIVMDVAEVSFPVAQSIKVDLSKKESVDAAADQVTGPIHAVFSCAGVADGTNNLMLINFTSQRHLLEKLIDKGVLSEGSSIGMISSVAGLGWEMQMPLLSHLLATPDWESAAAWVKAHDNTDNYVFSKQAMSAYVAQQAFPLLKKGIRINAIQPGPTDTPLARANADIWLAYGKEFRAEANVQTLMPTEMGDVLIFLCSDAARGINGVNLLVDQGQVSASVTGTFAPGA